MENALVTGCCLAIDHELIGRGSICIEPLVSEHKETAICFLPY